MAIEAQNGDVDLTSAVSIYNKTAAADGEWELDIRVGDGSKDLHTDAATLTLLVTVDGATINGGSASTAKDAAVLRAVLRIGPIFVANGDAITATLLSNNANDSDVDVTVTPRLLWTDTRQLMGDKQSTTDLKDFADTGYQPVLHKVAGVVTVTNLTNLPAITADWLTAAGIKADAVTAIQSGLSTHDAAAVVTALGTGSTLTDCLTATSVTVTSGTVTTLTNLPAITADWLTAAGIKADAVTAIQSGLSTHDAAAVVTALGTGSTLTDCLTATSVTVTSGTVTTLTNLPAITADWLTAAGIKADAVTAIQSGLSTHSAAAVWTAYNNEVIYGDMRYILGHLLTQTGTQVADAFESFFDVSTPTGTVNSLPAAVPDAAGGLPISDAGGLDLDTRLASQTNRDAMKLAPTAGDPAAGSLDKHADDILADTNELQTDWKNGGRLDLLLDAIPTAAAIAVAVWSYTTAAMDALAATTAGKWLRTILVAIKAKTDTVAAGSIFVTSPVAEDQTVSIVQYDDYLTATNRPLSWTNTSGDWFDSDITDAVVTFTAKTKEGVAVLEKAGAVVTATGTQEVTVDLTAANTALFTKAGKQYKYQLLLTKATYREVEVTGDLTVTLSLSPPAE